ncbi:MAG: PspC domain-containing protein [Rikenellaceae bacterium]|nr:PspC domain-containing protein [Rikenellaceae bacterium]
MNEIKRCSISGVGFTFEKAAYERLNNYLASLKEAYKNNPDSEEILADIEARVAELILSAQNDAECVVTLPIIENIVAQLGSPEDISGEESKAADSSESRIPRRLYRDLENAKLGGVCAGLAKHFGVDAVWIRLAMASPLILVVIGAPFLHWLSTLGGNLFAVFLITYLILWFAIPSAKSARQKLEAEGKPISASTIANRQGATQEEQAKSSVASVITTFGRFMVIVMKVLLGLLLFPVTFVVFFLLLSLVVITAGVSELFIVDIGNFAGVIDAANEVGVPLMVCALLLILVPIIYIGYLFITLLINKKPRWWVLLVTILAWLLVLIGTIFAGFNYAEERSFASFSSDSEVERIMKRFDDENDLSRQIMESLDEEPNTEQKAEIERLLNDKNAKSIDK